MASQLMPQLESETSLTPTAPELARFRELLQELNVAFERVESWAQSIHDEHPNVHVFAADNMPPLSSNESAKLQSNLLGTKEVSPEQVGTEGDDQLGLDTKMQKGGAVERGTSLTVPSETLLDSMPGSSINLKNSSIELNVNSHNPSRYGSSLKNIGSIKGIDDIMKSSFTESFEEDVRVNEFKAWFQKLLRKQSGSCEALALTPMIIESFFLHTDIYRTRDAAWISEAIIGFNRGMLALPADLKFVQRQKSVLEAYTPQTPQEDILTFEAFVELMAWSAVEVQLSPKLRRDALEIREVLIKHSVDELIYEFSGLTPPKQKKTRPRWTVIIEPIVGFVVVMNAITIGLGADSHWSGWEVLEAVYTAIFALEIILKICVFGFCEFFLGPEREWNWFDTIIVCMAVFDLVVTLSQGPNMGLGHFTIMRLARLAKITGLLRLVRFARLRCFKELRLLVKGVAASMRTLAWAFVFLATLVYIIGIMLRHTVGEDRIQMNDQYNTVLFHSVPWSMLNVFRCFIGDCALPDGTPILAHLYENYGYTFVVPWSVITLFVTFGVFNLIIAVFVENVQENARIKRQLTSDQERARVITLTREFVMMFGGRKPKKNPSDRTAHEEDCSEVFFQLGGMITRELFDEVIVEPRVHDILDELEVHVANHLELFDLLDADGNNSVDVSELIHGILKLRSGGADKSDIVATILGIRSLQKQLPILIEAVLEHQYTLHEDLKELASVCHQMKMEPQPRSQAIAL